MIHPTAAPSRVSHLFLVFAAFVISAHSANAQAPFFMAANPQPDTEAVRAVEDAVLNAPTDVNMAESLPQPIAIPSPAATFEEVPYARPILPNYAVARAQTSLRPAGCGPVLSAANRAAMCPRCGVDEAGLCCCDNGKWKRKQTVTEFNQFGQGEYIGPPRLHHVERYRMRVDDQVTLVYRLTRELNPTEYEFNVGDEVRIEGENLAGDDDPNGGGGTSDFDRTTVILPDGTITIPYIGQVRAAGRTVSKLRAEIQKRSKKWYKFPEWTVTPIRVNTRLEDLRAVVDARAGQGGQSIILRVSPDGTIQPPAIGSVCVQGLTLDEAKFEIDQRYAKAGFRGIEVSTILTERAPSFVYVLGEVNNPGRFNLERPTTVMGAISLAGSWRIGGNLRQIVVFRRADDWRLVATKINLQGALMGNHPTPADEIFLRDADIILVPKNPIQRVDDAINLVFTQGFNPLITFGSAAGFLNLSFAQ